MEGLAILITVVAISFLLAIFIDWLCHITLTRERASVWGWGNYTKFKREFEKIYRADEIGFFSNSKDGVFGKGWRSETDIYIYATVIIFKSQGMVINNPVSFQLTKLYIRKYIKNNSPFAGKKSKENRIKW